MVGLRARPNGELPVTFGTSSIGAFVHICQMNGTIHVHVHRPREVNDYANNMRRTSNLSQM